MQKIIFDAHQDVLSYVTFGMKKMGNKVKQTGFEELVVSPIKLVTASVFLDPKETSSLNNLEKIESIKKQIKKYLSVIQRNRNLMLVKSKKDLAVLMNSKATGILIHIEGIDFITDKNLGVINEFYELGLRSAGLVWGQKNSLAADCQSEGGLTRLGKKFVAVANNLGIIIDLAHANKETFRDVLSFSKKPVMVSHGNCFELCKEKRNLDCLQIKELGDNGGVQGIYFSRKYIGRGEKLSINDVVNHFIYVYSIAPDSVMIGSDFGGISSGFVAGLESVDKLDALLAEIKERFGEKAGDKIAYKNYLNFLKKVL
jgi:membrane dipeptidase